MSEFSGIWIPKEILLNHSFSPVEKLILSDIFNITQKGQYFKNNKTISKDLGISQSTISRTLTKLERGGVVNMTRVDQNRVVNMTRGVVNMTRGVVNMTKGGSQNDYHKEQLKEKYKENLNKKAEISFPFVEKEFLSAWAVWIDERKIRKIRKYTPRGEQSALHNLQKISNNDYKTAIQIINNSISHGYQGLFPLKNSDKARNTKIDSEKALRWANSSRT